MKDLPSVALHRSVSQMKEPTITDDRLKLLWPTPQKFTSKEGPAFMPRETLPIFISNNTNDDTGENDLFET